MRLSLFSHWVWGAVPSLGFIKGLREQRTGTGVGLRGALDRGDSFGHTEKEKGSRGLRWDPLSRGCRDGARLSLEERGNSVGALDTSWKVEFANTHQDSNQIPEQAAQRVLPSACSSHSPEQPKLSGAACSAGWNRGSPELHSKQGSGIPWFLSVAVPDT